jgi:hypothetical protein
LVIVSDLVTVTFVSVESASCDVEFEEGVVAASGVGNG